MTTNFCIQPLFRFFAKRRTYEAWNGEEEGGEEKDDQDIFDDDNEGEE